MVNYIPEFLRPNTIETRNIMVRGNRVFINGKWLPPCPSSGRTQVVINGKVYIDGYEFKKGEWKRTLKARWYCR